jgi:hypothetical protein
MREAAEESKEACGMGVPPNGTYFVPPSHRGTGVPPVKAIVAQKHDRPG